MNEFKEAMFIHVDVDDGVILNRLKIRNNNLDLNYLIQKVKPNFEQPDDFE